MGFLPLEVAAWLVAAAELAAPRRVAVLEASPFAPALDAFLRRTPPVVAATDFPFTFFAVVGLALVDLGLSLDLSLTFDFVEVLPFALPPLPLPLTLASPDLGLAAAAFLAPAVAFTRRVLPVPDSRARLGLVDTSCTGNPCVLG